MKGALKEVKHNFRLQNEEEDRCCEQIARKGATQCGFGRGIAAFLGACVVDRDVLGGGLAQ